MTVLIPCGSSLSPHSRGLLSRERRPRLKCDKCSTECADATEFCPSCLAQLGAVATTDGPPQPSVSLPPTQTAEPGIAPQATSGVATPMVYAAAGLVAGLLGILTSCFMVGLVLSAVGMLPSLLALKQAPPGPRANSLAWGGVVTSAIGLVLGLVSAAFLQFFGSVPWRF